MLHARQPVALWMASRRRPTEATEACKPAPVQLRDVTPSGLARSVDLDLLPSFLLFGQGVLTYFYSPQGEGPSLPRPNPPKASAHIQQQPQPHTSRSEEAPGSPASSSSSHSHPPPHGTQEPQEPTPTSPQTILLTRHLSALHVTARSGPARAPTPGFRLCVPSARSHTHPSRSPTPLSSPSWGLWSGCP